MAEQTYNGWRNVETWRVQLHLANDEGEARAASNTAICYAVGAFPASVSLCVDENGEVHRDGGPFKGTFAEFLRDRVERGVERIYRSESAPYRGAWEMYARDVVEAGLSRVDWDAIAEHWLEAARHDLEQGAARG
jgi:hypothetical protein